MWGWGGGGTRLNCQPYSSLRAHPQQIWVHELLEWSLKVALYPYFWTGRWATPALRQWYHAQKEIRPVSPGYMTGGLYSGGNFNIAQLCHRGKCCQVVDNHQPANELKELPPPLRHPWSQHLEYALLVLRADLYLESFKTCLFLLRPICVRE